MRTCHIDRVRIGWVSRPGSVVGLHVVAKWAGGGDGYGGQSGRELVHKVRGYVVVQGVHKQGVCLHVYGCRRVLQRLFGRCVRVVEAQV